MENKNSNASAFPCDNNQSSIHNGLSKREYFAAMAMQGLISKYKLNEPSDQKIICQLSVELADEILLWLND